MDASHFSADHILPRFFPDSSICIPVYCPDISLGLCLFPAGPEDYDYSYPDIEPVFLSRPTSYSVRNGDSIVLPCEINDLGQSLIRLVHYIFPK